MSGRKNTVITPTTDSDLMIGGLEPPLLSLDHTHAPIDNGMQAEAPKHAAKPKDSLLTNLASGTASQNLAQGAAGLVQQLEVLQARRPGWFCLCRSNTLLALFLALLMIPLAGIGLLILRNTFIGAMFLTNPVIGFAVLYLSLVSLWALAIRAVAIILERRAIKKFTWPSGTPESIDSQAASQLIEQLRQSRGANSVIGKRMLDGLSYFSSGKNVSETRAFMESQAIHDANALHSSFSTMNLIVWTLPILGFIGTVWGIGLAIGPFAVVVQDASEIDGIKDGLIDVIAGLSTAFQTTFLSLVASVLVMFPRSAVQKSAEATLATIDQRVDRELFGRIRDRVSAERLEPESLLRAFDEMLDRYQRQWAQQLNAMTKSLADHLGRNFQLHLTQSAEQQNQLISRFESSLSSSSAGFQEVCRSLDRAMERTVTLATQTTEKLAQIGNQTHERLVSVAPGCQQIADMMSDLVSKHDHFHRTASEQFLAVDGSFKQMSLLLRQSTEQIGTLRQVQLPAETNEAILHVSRTIVPVAKIMKQQVEVQGALLRTLQTTRPTEKPSPSWWSRIFLSDAGSGTNGHQQTNGHANGNGNGNSNGNGHANANGGHHAKG